MCRASESFRWRNRDVRPARDGWSSGRAGLPAQAAEVVNHLCGADRAEREARWALAENAPDPIRDGCLADGRSIRVVERAIVGIQLCDCLPAAAGIPVTEDLGNVSLHKVSERGHRGAHHSHDGEWTLTWSLCTSIRSTTESRPDWPPTEMNARFVPIVETAVFNGLSSRCQGHPPRRARGGCAGAGVSQRIVAPLPGDRILDRIPESLVRDPSRRRLG